jgi:catechol 2,3-dioxygenase-like lactoylglutathione lyase family enzyme
MGRAIRLLLVTVMLVQLSGCSPAPPVTQAEPDTKEKVKLKLHEIELNAKDPEASKKFYHETLGLPMGQDQKGLKVFNVGWPSLDLDASVHFPGKVSISFLVNDLDTFVRQLRAKGIQVPDPGEGHLGLRGVVLEDPDGHRVEIHSPTDKSPDWLKNMVE